MMQNVVQNPWYSVVRAVNCGSCSQPNGFRLFPKLFHWERLSSTVDSGTSPCPDDLRNRGSNRRHSHHPHWPQKPRLRAQDAIVESHPGGNPICRSRRRCIEYIRWQGDVLQSVVVPRRFPTSSLRSWVTVPCSLADCPCAHGWQSPVQVGHLALNASVARSACISPQGKLAPAALAARVKKCPFNAAVESTDRSLERCEVRSD
jgi:hypothetical protein